MKIELPDYAANVTLTRRPPVEILRDIASEMPDKTGGVVHATVFTVNPGGGNLFQHTFSLRVPRLNDYTLSLLYVSHGLSLYPSTFLPTRSSLYPDTEDSLSGRLDKGAIECKSENELTETLQRFFALPQTVQLIHELIQAAGGIKQ